MALSFDKRQAITGFEGEDPNASAAMDALKGYGAKFIRDMNPFRTGQPSQPQGQQAAQTQQPSAVGQTPAPSPQPQSEAMQALTRSPNTDTPGQQAARENAGPVNLQPSGIKQALASDPRNIRVDNGTPPAGMSRTYNQNGTITYSTGEPGKDGYGRMTVIPGSGRPVSQQSPAQRLASGPMSNATTVQGANGPYSVSGDPAAVAAFSRPVAPAVGWDGNTSAGEAPAYQQVRARNDTASRLATIQPPEYLGPESGLGWQTRLKKYDNELDVYSKATGQQAQMDIERMREAGAGMRSMQQAQQANDANALTGRRLKQESDQFSAGQPLRDAQAQTEQARASQMTEENNVRKQLATIPPGSPAYVAAERRLAALSGRYGEVKQQNVKEVDELIDPAKPAMGTRKALVNVNPDGTYTKMQEAGGGTGGDKQQKKPLPLPKSVNDAVDGETYDIGGKPAKWNAEKQNFVYLP